MKLNLDIKETRIVELKGKEYIVRQATIGESREVQRLIKLEESEEFDIYIDLMDKLGVPKDILMGLNDDQFSRVIEFIMGSAEKKS